MKTFSIILNLAFVLNAYSQTLLFEDDFESGSLNTLGWTQSGSSTWQVRTGEVNGKPSFSYSGAMNVSLYNYNTGTSTKLISPIINFTGHTNGYVEFYYTNDDSNGGNYDDLRVFYSTTGTSGPWTLIHLGFQTDQYKRQIINLPSVNSNYCIAFESENWQAYGICIDNIKVCGTNASIDPTGSYCNASTVHGPDGDNQITGFMLNEIRLQSPNTNGFGDNYSHLDAYSYGAASLIAGQYHHLQYVDGYSGHSYTEQIQIWIDYNGDGDYTDSGELIDSQSFPASLGNTKAIYFYVPQTAKTGKTRLRIRNINSTTSIDPCISYAYGQTFDFDVYIYPSIGPAPLVFDGGNQIHSVNKTHYITNVNLGNINNTTSYFGVANMTGVNIAYNYSNFTGQFSTTIKEENTYNLTVTQSNTAATIGAWIDWNNDGDFNDASELLGPPQYSASGTSKTFTFTVPTGFTYNKFVVMRTRLVRSNVSATLTATNTYSGNATPYNNNETEDYKVYLAPKDAPLPVDWLSFEASHIKPDNVLYWETASEINSDYFGLEHSTDAQHYESIGSMSAAGQSNQIINYQFTHFQPERGPHYYRIKQVDTDGQFEYSEVRYIEIEQEVLSIYPNPTSDWLYIKTSESSENAYYIIDLMGQEIIKTSQNPINVAELPSGAYIIKSIQHPNWHARWIKQ